MNKSATIVIRVTPELKAQLQRLANESGRSLGNLIIWILLHANKLPE